MTDKTIPEIREEHGAKASAVLSGYHAEIDGIREQRELEEGAYLDRLTDDQRMTLLLERKRERADDARRRALDAYRREVERYQGELSDRATMLEASLFGTEGPEGAAALSRAALASEEELGTMLDLAARAKNEELAKSVFVAAEQRGFAALVVGALDHAGASRRPCTPSGATCRRRRFWSASARASGRSWRRRITSGSWTSRGLTSTRGRGFVEKQRRRALPGVRHSARRRARAGGLRGRVGGRARVEGRARLRHPDVLPRMREATDLWGGGGG